MAAGRLTTGPSPIRSAGSRWRRTRCCPASPSAPSSPSAACPDPARRFPPTSGALIGCAVITGVGAAIETLCRSRRAAAVSSSAQAASASAHPRRPAGARGHHRGRRPGGSRRAAGDRAGGDRGAIDAADLMRCAGLRDAAPAAGFDWTHRHRRAAGGHRAGRRVGPARGDSLHRRPCPSGHAGAGGHARPRHLRADDHRLGVRVGHRRRCSSRGWPSSTGRGGSRSTG